MESFKDQNFIILDEESYKAMDSNTHNIININSNRTSTDEISGSKEYKLVIENEDHNEYVVQLRNVFKTYIIGSEGISALRGVSLDVKKGEFLIILGTSGGGKTTLLNVIGTIDTHSRGDLKIFGTLIRSKSEDAYLASIRLDEVAFVFQSFNLLPNLNVIENVEIPMKIKGTLSAQEIRKRALELLDKLGLSSRLNHFPNQLSGGEQQRVTIARALANKPKILLLDEPTGDLDTKNSDIVMNILLDLNLSEKITMIMVTHDITLKVYAERIIKVIDGKVHSIQNIEKSVRDENIKRLNDRISNKFLGLREGVNDNNSNIINACSNNKTFIRKVSDYKIKKSNKFIV